MIAVAMAVKKYLKTVRKKTLQSKWQMLKNSLIKMLRLKRSREGRTILLLLTIITLTKWIFSLFPQKT